VPSWGTQIGWWCKGDESPRPVRAGRIQGAGAAFSVQIDRRLALRRRRGAPMPVGCGFHHPVASTTSQIEVGDHLLADASRCRRYASESISRPCRHACAMCAVSPCGREPAVPIARANEHRRLDRGFFTTTRKPHHGTRRCSGWSSGRRAAQHWAAMRPARRSRNRTETPAHAIGDQAGDALHGLQGTLPVKRGHDDVDLPEKIVIAFHEAHCSSARCARAACAACTTSCPFMSSSPMLTNAVTPRDAYTCGA